MICVSAKYLFTSTLIYILVICLIYKQCRLCEIINYNYSNFQCEIKIQSVLV